MANPPQSGGGQLPLQEFRRDVPPGWTPGDPAYPLRLYMEKLQLWYKTTNLEDEIVGPMVAGRLHGRAAKVAMALRVPRPDGGVDVGPDALSRLSVDEVVDPAGNVIQQHIASGVQFLLNSLRQAFGQQDQDLATASLDRFFSLTRSNQKMTLSEYAVEFDARYDEAHERAGLQLNDVGKFYLWFKHSALPHKTIDDIKMQIAGDYTRYQEARSLALRLSTNHHMASDSDIFYETNMVEPYYEDYDAEYKRWHGYGDMDEDYYEYWEDYDMYPDDYDDDGHYYWDDEQQWWVDEYEEHGQERHTPEDPSDSKTAGEGQEPGEQEIHDYYKGKGKGKSSDGCFNCGSKWHHAKDCPLQGKSSESRDGKGKGSSYGKSKGKGKSKGGRFRWRPPYKGSSKGYGKHKGYGKPPSGKGFGKRHWYATTPVKQSLNFSEGIPDASTKKTSTTTSTASHMTMMNKNHGVEKTEHHIIHTSSEEEDYHWLKRPPRPTMATEGNAESAQPPEKTEKKHSAAFAFAVFHAERHKEVDSYFSVRGEQRQGLLIDPGAASGLIGSDTLKELMDKCIAPLGKEHEVKLDQSRTTPVSGINGGSNQTLGEITLPLQAGGQPITYTAEIIGGDGSMCPALVGNPTLRRMDASIFANWFANGDGLMMVGGRDNEENSKHYRLFRLLLTESGHYILPTDHANSGKVAKETKKEVVLFTQRVAQESMQRWDDVHPRLRHCFLANNNHDNQAAEQTEGDRGEIQVRFDENIIHDDHQEPATEKTDPKQQKEEADGLEPANLVDKSPAAAQQDEPHDNHHHEYLATTLDQTEDAAILAAQKWPDEDFPAYQEDQLPDGVDHTKLNRRYRALPQEFYSKTGMRPVTPKNFNKWFARTRGKGLRWHCWELFSGTGRLSLILLMAGLIVGFPWISCGLQVRMEFE